MKISKIYPNITLNVKTKTEQKTEKREEQEPQQTELQSQFNDHLIAFTGLRVDKGLNRFFDINKDRMPKTVFKFVKEMVNRELLTPLEAQRKAFSEMENLTSIEEIKRAFPEDKELFGELINPQDSKAKRGIIHSFNEMSELYEDGILKGKKENLTVYLVKKIFLEGKTVDEINKDLAKDLDTDFMKYFKFNNPESPFVRSSTLNALGIKMPDKDYMQSLKYTKDGYSDVVGAKISNALNEFIANLTPEERTARNKKTVTNFENWWSTLSESEKLDMIADKDAELNMLKRFKKDARAEKKRIKAENPALEQEPPKTKTKNNSGEKVHSKLSDDELFKIWARYNTKIYLETLSEASKDSLHIRRVVNLVNRWKEMSPAERTDYISKMKAGAEPLRFALIDAWNNSPEIITALSKHLKENQVYKPADLLYSADEFSQFQSKVMSEFWDNNPEFAENLGNRIKLSYEKIKQSIESGKFEDLKQEINRNKNIRKKEIENSQKASKPQIQEKPIENDYKTEFRNIYLNHPYGNLKSFPQNYLNDTFKVLFEKLPENVIKTWAKNLKGEKLTEEESKLLQKNLLVEFPEIQRINRAFEASMADSLYEITKDPRMFELSNSDIKTVMYHVERGDSPIQIVSHKNNQQYFFEIPNKHKRPDTTRINHLYETYKKDLSQYEVEDIIRYNFAITKPDGVQVTQEEYNQTYKALEDYIKSYGKSANILFSEKSAYPAVVKEFFNRKFNKNMPSELKASNILTSYMNKADATEYNELLTKAKILFGKRFSFLPKDVLEVYGKELGVFLRENERQDFNISEFINTVCRKRQRPSDHGKIVLLPKQYLKTEHKFNMLAMEQSMADALFEATRNENVYKMPFESLCDKFELFSLVKSFPVEATPAMTYNGEQIELVLKKKLNTFSLERKYKAYMKEINEWLKENPKNSTPDYEQLLYILNPEEGNGIRDINTGIRMMSYFKDMTKISFTPVQFP